MDDLFLDIILLPSGEIIEKDADELEHALLTGTINNKLYNVAWNEMKRIKQLIRTKNFELVNISHVHKEMLVAFLS